MASKNSITQNAEFMIELDSATEGAECVDAQMLIETLKKTKEPR